MRCGTSPGWGFCRQLRGTSGAWEQIGIGSPRRYTCLRVLHLHLRLFVKGPALRVHRLLDLRDTSPWESLVLGGLSLGVKRVGYACCNALESAFWLCSLLLTFLGLMCGVLVVLMLKFSLCSILLIEGLRKTVRYWWWQMIRCGGRLRECERVRVHLLLLLLLLLLLKLLLLLLLLLLVLLLLLTCIILFDR
jgi:hypothetical protein